MMRIIAATAVLSLLACTEKPKAPPRPPPPTEQRAGAVPQWPGAMVVDWKQVAIAREARLTTAELVGGVWRLGPPRQGDADPDAIDRLKLALTSPQILSATFAENPPPRFPPTGPVAGTQIRIKNSTGKTWDLFLPRVPLGAAVVAQVAGVGDFTVSPVEMSNKIPDPEDFLTPGLWTAANKKEISVEVKGPVNYRVEGQGEEWKVVKGKKPRRDVEDVAGVITGRQASGHPTGDAKSLGLDPPTATARLCTKDECREFVFGSAATDAGVGYFARAPDSEPLELRESDWHLLVNGPF